MPKVRRVYWGRRRGRIRCTFNTSIINDQSVVLIAASEGDEANTTASPARFVGAAPYRVENIAPTNGGVVFYVHIDWGSPIPLWTDIVVLDEVPQGFIR